MEDTGLRRLHIEDYPRPDSYSGATAGQKRRASSPPGMIPIHYILWEVLVTCSGVANLEVELPRPPFHSTSGSMSSTASGPRSNSYASTTLSIGASSITSMSSYGRLSPGGISPVPTDGSDSPYVTSLSLNPSPRGSLSRTNHNRNISETRPLMTSRKLSDTIGHSKHNSIPKMQGVFICECCPRSRRSSILKKSSSTYQNFSFYSS